MAKQIEGNSQAEIVTREMFDDVSCAARILARTVSDHAVLMSSDGQLCRCIFCCCQWRSDAADQHTPHCPVLVAQAVLQARNAP